jgi:hypothetical protein
MCCAADDRSAGRIWDISSNKISKNRQHIYLFETKFKDIGVLSKISSIEPLSGVCAVVSL